MAIKAIIFDFDGVITESVDVKTRAFKELFKDYPQSLVSAIEKFHLDNGGMSRFDKFRHIYKNILNKELSEAEFNRLCVDFNKLVVEDVVKAPLVKGVKSFLDSYKDRLPMYIVSATPDSEIKEIVGRKGLEKYFLAVYGSPATKAECIKNVLGRQNHPAKSILFIGDSRNDHHAAQETGVIFAARAVGPRQDWLEAAGIAFIFSDFEELNNNAQFNKILR